MRWLPVLWIDVPWIDVLWIDVLWIDVLWIDVLIDRAGLRGDDARRPARGTWTCGEGS